MKKRGVSAAALVVVVAALVLPLGGCVSSSDGVYAAQTTGALSARWSIDGSFDPTQCDRFAAVTLDLRIYDPNGGFVTESLVPCQQSSVQVVLYPGTYTGQMTLTDAANVARTTTLNLAPFTIFEGGSTPVDTDFPADSFF